MLSSVWAPEGVEHGGSKGRNAGVRGKPAELTVLSLRTGWMGGSLEISGGDTSLRPYSNHSSYARCYPNPFTSCRKAGIPESDTQGGTGVFRDCPLLYSSQWLWYLETLHMITIHHFTFLSQPSTLQYQCSIYLNSQHSVLFNTI